MQVFLIRVVLNNTRMIFYFFFLQLSVSDWSVVWNHRLLIVWLVSTILLADRLRSILMHMHLSSRAGNFFTKGLSNMLYSLSCSKRILSPSFTSFICTRNVSAVALWKLKYTVSDAAHPVDTILEDVGKALELVREGSSLLCKCFFSCRLCMVLLDVVWSADVYLDVCLTLLDVVFFDLVVCIVNIFWSSLGSSNEGSNLLERAYAIALNAFGEENESTLRVRHLLAVGCFNAGILLQSDVFND